ncbi:Pentatricopeptide repeat-containing protein [Apostasia shenzhenica]|uniref:Pentatricopeptide repeat-containing protein n=1 Tax=Apostasia shenzhenica TaxID=1088818 RepID=A0A2I0A2S0_9ASPA|nr:Pentatricopeptide repeat-containing protein [Apostasia shenzhenica]
MVFPAGGNAKLFPFKHSSLKIVGSHIAFFYHHLSRTPLTLDEDPIFKTTKLSVLAHPLIRLLEKCQTVDQLKQIQSKMVLSGLISDAIAASRLVAFCAISDSADLDYCSSLMRNLKHPNLFSWNVAIRGCSSSHRPQESIFLYTKLLRSNVRPDNFTYPFLFKACSRVRDVGAGLAVFGHAFQLGMCVDLFVYNALLHFLVVCGTLVDARKLFDGSSSRDLVSWNTIINGFVQRGNPGEALELVKKMEEEGILPNEVTMLGAISSCAQLQALKLGRKFHLFMVDNGMEFTTHLTNALIDMYVKCGSLEPARCLFDTMESKTVVSWTTIISGYAKSGLLVDARKMFDEMPEKDVILWNALLSGYLHCGQAKDVISLFHEMQASSVEPDQITFLCLLSACSQVGASEMGIWIHRYLEKHKFLPSVELGTALVDMYAKCGNIEKACCVFRQMPDRNALTWTAMICGLASHGHASEAIEHFQSMVEIGILPDEITFLGVLSACCHSGLLREGRMFFYQMTSDYNLKPKLKHYSCMVDLLGRSGCLEEAEELIKRMPMEADAVIWSALFFACRLHRNFAMGERAAARLLELDPTDSGIYVLLANLYAEENMRDKADQVWALMKERGVEKTPGCSSIELKGVVCEFIVRDKSHPDHEEIYACLKQLYDHLKHYRSIPDHRFSEDAT